MHAFFMVFLRASIALIMGIRFEVIFSPHSWKHDLRLTISTCKKEDKMFFFFLITTNINYITPRSYIGSLRPRREL